MMRNMKIRTRIGHTFVVDHLGPNATVVDLGMNKGAFARYIVETSGASVVGAEPVPTLFATLPKTGSIRPFNVAVGGNDGTITLRLYQHKCATTQYALVKGERHIGEVEVPLVSFARFRALAGIGVIQLLKVDIEGAELDMFEAMSDAEFADIEQITVEFHDFLDLSYVPRIQAMLKRLVAVGFYVLNISLRHHADVVCLNMDAFPLTALARAQMQIHKLVQGAVRVPRRHLFGLPN